MAERRGNGLQSRVHGFKSRLHLEEHHERAIGAAVARFPDTEEVTGSIPVSPTSTKWPLTSGNVSQGPLLSCSGAVRETPNPTGISHAGSVRISGRVQRVHISVHHALPQVSVGIAGYPNGRVRESNLDVLEIHASVDADSRVSVPKVVEPALVRYGRH